MRETRLWFHIRSNFPRQFNDMVLGLGRRRGGGGGAHILIVFVLELAESFLFVMIFLLSL